MDCVYCPPNSLNWYNTGEMKQIAWTALSAALGAAILAAAPAQTSPADTVARFEKTLLSLRSFQADFEQTSASSSLSVPLKEKGRLFVQKGDLMRWEYNAPERKTFIFKDGLALSYFPEDNQMWRQRISAEDMETDLPAILTGKARLTERYTVALSPFPGSAPGSPQLRLTPKADQNGSFILIEIDPGTGMLRRAVLYDWAGNKTEFAFSRFKANPKLAPDFFELKVPPGCEVIDGERPRKK